ncbi:MAG TPA: DPP IV N-terminal domain-containing protein, partial [Bacteroidota bacterium]|nr:DPP IV N-terminal domain-containing protein [Bacteroidota bacterium]
MALPYVLKLLGKTLPLLAASFAVLAQDIPQPTIEWMHSAEALEATVTPTTRWLSDNRLVLYDVRKPPAERTVEILDPVSGKRTVLIDQNAARASLRTVLGDSATPTFLPFPQELAGNGKTALYIFKGDAFVLDIPSLSFSRVTETPAQESCVRLSPDGSRVAYVRGNNLYVYDRTMKAERQLTGDGSDSLRNGTLSWVYWEEVFGRNDLGYWWSPDSRAIAYFRTDESGVST